MKLKNYCKNTVGFYSLNTRKSYKVAILAGQSFKDKWVFIFYINGL